MEDLYEVQIGFETGPWETWKVFSFFEEAEKEITAQLRVRDSRKRKFRIKKTERVVTYLRETEVSGAPTFSEIRKMVDDILENWMIPDTGEISEDVVNSLLMRGAFPQFGSEGNPVKDLDMGEETGTEPLSPPGARFEIRDDDGDVFGLYRDLERAKEALRAFVKTDPKNAADLYIVEFGEDGQREEFVFVSNSKGLIFAASFDDDGDNPFFNTSPGGPREETLYEVVGVNGSRWGDVFCSSGEALDWIQSQLKWGRFPEGAHLLVAKAKTTRTVVDEFVVPKK